MNSLVHRIIISPFSRPNQFNKSICEKRECATVVEWECERARIFHRHLEAHTISPLWQRNLFLQIVFESAIPVWDRPPPVLLLSYSFRYVFILKREGKTHPIVWGTSYTVGKWLWHLWTGSQIQHLQRPLRAHQQHKAGLCACCAVVLAFSRPPISWNDLFGKWLWNSWPGGQLQHLQRPRRLHHPTHQHKPLLCTCCAAVSLLCRPPTAWKFLFVKWLPSSWRGGQMQLPQRPLHRTW